MDLSIAAAYIVAAGLPLILLLLSALFRHFYLDAIAREFKKQAPTSASDGQAGFDPTRAPLTFLWRDANTVDEWLRPIQEVDAARDTRRMKAAFIASGIVWAVCSAVVVWAGLTAGGMTPRSAAAVASMNTASALAVVLAFARPRLGIGLLAAIAWVGLEFMLLTGPGGAAWRNAASILARAPLDGILVPVPAMALFALRSLRPLIAGFVPAVGLWIGVAVMVGVTVTALGGSLDGPVSVSMMALGAAAALVGAWTTIRQIRKGISRSFVVWWSVYLAAVSAIGWISGSTAFNLLIGVGVNGSLVLVGWALFRYFLRLKAQGRITDEVLHFSGCWLLLSVWTFVVARLEWAQLPWVLAPMIAYGIVLYAMLRTRQTRRPARAPKRLLLLRVFRQTSGDTRLLDALDDSWRRHGSLDLVVWMDLALSTLNALTIENFLVGRVDRQFLRDEADARTRLPQLPDAIALDGRYPMNELHCQSGIWQEVVARLARESDVVLMDLRGFQQSNEGVIAELSLVVRHVRLSRIVLLTDARTDERLLADVVQNAWHALPPDSPNANASDLAQLQVVRSSASWSVTARAVARQVFTAGFGETPVQLARVS